MVYKCPVCEGRGFVCAGFYGNISSPFYTSNLYGENTTCRSCCGTGIIRDFPQPLMCPSLGSITNPNEEQGDVSK